MTTLLAQHHRRAAHGKHRCGYCFRPIPARSEYLDQRVADGGRVYTFRAHHDCQSAFWSWNDGWMDGGELFIDLTDGHLPPCPMAWAKRQDEPCTCEVPPHG